MRVLHLGKYYPPVRGGMETVLANITEGLLEAGDAVAVLVAGTDDLTRRRALTSESGSEGLLVQCACAGVWNSQPLTWALPGVLRELLRDFRPDLVHLHLPNPLAAAAWRMLIAGGESLPPLVIWHHADMLRQRLGATLLRPLVRGCLERAVAICISSADLAESSRELAPFRKRWQVIPFGIAAGDSAPLTTARDGPFLFVGRLVPYKGVDVLLDALARTPAASLDVVGEGPQRAGLEDQAARRGLQDRVRFRGELGPAALTELRARARALVLPSLDGGETFGLVQIEAMAAGCPVIVSDLPTGVARVGEDGVSVLTVPPGDPEALASALRRLQENPELGRRLGGAGRLRYQACYRRERMIKALRDCYAGVLAN